MRTRSAVSLVDDPGNPDPTLLWYSRAIGILRAKRKFIDPTSWRYLGAVHDYHPSTDPYTSSSDPPPTASEQKTYWKKCQHASWFFLPWHRMYLYYFERIVAGAVVEAGGPSGWALPFWDYGARTSARMLPEAFRNATWPSGEPNYLFVDRRAPGINAGTASLSPRDVDATAALAMKHFSSAPSSSDVAFGGPRVKNHEGGAPGSPPFGGVESSPHNNVHVAVGGQYGNPSKPTLGFMIDPTTAALDPIFWLHHANIDRLWELWMRAPYLGEKPREPAWLKATFQFHDDDGKRAKLACSEVLATTDLGYGYAGIKTPLPTARATRAALTPTVGRPELLGATAKAFNVSALKTVSFATIHPKVRAAATPAEPRRVLLHLEEVHAGRSPGSYDVFVNASESGLASDGEEFFAGRVSLFGGMRRPGQRGEDAQRTFSFVLDITGLRGAQSHAGAWDPTKVRVTLKPVYDWSDPVKVGRVSLSVL